MERVVVLKEIDVNGGNETNHSLEVKRCTEDTTTVVRTIDVNDTTTIFKRRVLYRAVDKLDMSESGKHELKVCINKKGYVTYVELLNSTSKSENFKKKLLNTVSNYFYEPDLRAPCEQCGNLTVRLDINKFK